MTDAMENEYQNRLTRLRELRTIIDDFEEYAREDENQSVLANLRKARNRMEQAGDSLTNQHFERHYLDAAGKVAGLAIGRGYDEIAERVFEVTDLDPEAYDE